MILNSLLTKEQEQLKDETCACVSERERGENGEK